MVMIIFHLYFGKMHLEIFCLWDEEQTLNFSQHVKKLKIEEKDAVEIVSCKSVRSRLTKR